MKIVPSLPDPEQNKRGLTLRISRRTSEEAAELILPRSGTLRFRVLMALADYPAGLTDSEIALVTGLSYNSFGPRRRELFKMGWVTDSGRRRPSVETKASQEVWVLTPDGRTAWANRI